MKELALEALADKLLKEGKSHQEVFDELALTSDTKLTKIAEILRKTPSLKKRRKFKPSNMVLCSLLTLIILIHFTEFMEVLENNLLAAISQFLLKIVIPIIILYGIYNFRRNAHLVAAFYFLLSMLAAGGKLFTSPDLFALIVILCGAAGTIVGFYLNRALSTDYTYQRTLHQQYPALREGVMKFDE